jgi:hypothetical protein
VNRPDVEEAPTRRIRVNQADVSVVSGTDEHASEQPKS